MPFIPTPRGVEVVVKATQNTIPVVNVYHVDVAGPVDDTNLQDVRNVFGTWMTGTLLPLLDSSYVLNEIVATDISVANGHQFSTSYTTGNAGGISGQPAAANAAVVISWRTASIGRSFRGRTYIGGLNNGILVSAQNIGTTYATSFAGAAQDLIDLLTTAGYILSVLSKFSNLVARAAGVLTEIISFVVDTKVDSQRRRTAN